MNTINCDKVSLRLACNHTLVMPDVIKVEYDSNCIVITLAYDNVMLLTREVHLYIESFKRGLAIKVIRCYVSNRYVGSFEYNNSSIVFVSSSTI